MAVRVWLSASDEERLGAYASVSLEHYAGEGRETLVTGTLDGGAFTRIAKDFVLGKVRFFEKRGSAHRTPWVRVDNHACWPQGAYFTPNSWINVRYHAKSKTMDQHTSLKRIELLSAPENDFIRRVFVTYDCNALVPKPREHERHFLVYCDETHLNRGKVGRWQG